METTLTDLGDLRAFCLVVDLGSIIAAAKALGEGKGASVAGSRGSRRWSM